MELEDLTVVLVVAGIFVVLVFIVTSIIPRDNTGKQECFNQCELKNLNFSSYTGGGYSNYMCNCINQSTKQISTIYSK